MINLRSPYFVIKQTANLTQVDLDISTYVGTLSTDEPAAQYSLTSGAITPATGNPYVVFDIADLARDFIESTFDGTYTSTCVWVAYQITEYISDVAQTPEAVVRIEGFDGYRYFEEGVQSNDETYTAPDLLQSNTLIYKSDDGVVRVPILQTNITDVYFLYKGEIVDSESITATRLETTDIIQYVSNTGASYDTFKARVEAVSATFEESALENVFKRYYTHPCDAVILDDGTTQTKLTVKDIHEQKHTPYKLTFVNKFGALQDLWFFKRSRLSISTQKKTYKSNILSIGTYDTTHHQEKILDKNGRETLQMNSGWYPEDYNEVFKQLYLSEVVWIDYDGSILPVNVSDNGMEFKTSVGDKLINNSISIDFAFNKLNNIR